MRLAVPTVARLAPAVIGMLLVPLPTSAQAPAAPGATVRLTVDEAVRLALEQNLALRVERINPSIAEENVRAAETSWTPTLTGNLFYNSTDTPPDSFLAGSTDTLKSDAVSGDVGVSQLLPWGANWLVAWDARRSTTNSIFTTFDPTLRSNLSLTFVQPLLRNRAVDAARQQLVISKRSREISDEQLRGTVVTTVRAVKNAYWNLKYAIANLAAQQQSLDLARQTLRDNRTRVEIGTMAPIDIVEAEAEVARNEENVIVAEAAIRQAEDQLRTLILDPSSPDYWSTRLEPIDVPEMRQQTIDVEAAVRNALTQRTDLLASRLSLQNVESNLAFYRNQSLPQVNLQIDYGTTGLGGTQGIREPGFPPGPVIREISRGFGSVLGDLFTADFPRWQVGVSISYPIGRSPSASNYARTLLELNQAKLQLQNLELQIAYQVRELARQVTSNAQRVQATTASRVLAERRLEAEQKKFAVGTSTSFLVFQAQRDLLAARTNELKAILDYNQSLVDFEAVQQAAITGGGIVLAGSGTPVAAQAPTRTMTTAAQATAAARGR